MSSLNRVQLIGNLGRAPEMTYTRDGKAICKFSIATNEFDKTMWHRIVAWDKLAEVCTKYLRSGSQVYVEGRLSYHSWTDKDGQKHHSTEIQLQEIKFLGAKKGEGKESADTSLSISTLVDHGDFEDDD